MKQVLLYLLIIAAFIGCSKDNPTETKTATPIDTIPAIKSIITVPPLIWTGSSDSGAVVGLIVSAYGLYSNYNKIKTSSDSVWGVVYLHNGKAIAMDCIQSWYHYPDSLDTSLTTVLVRWEYDTHTQNVWLTPSDTLSLSDSLTTVDSTLVCFTWWYNTLKYCKLFIK